MTKYDATSKAIGHYLLRCDVSQTREMIQGITYKKVNVKWSRYRPGVAQRMGRGIALLSHDRGTRRAWVVSSTPQPHFIPGKDPVPILQEAGWAPGPVWTGGNSRPHWDSIPDLPAHSQSLYRLSYLTHKDSLIRKAKSFCAANSEKCWLFIACYVVQKVEKYGFLAHV